jgi:hypothetical protein
MLGAEKPFQVDGLLAALQKRQLIIEHNGVVDDYNSLKLHYDAEVLTRKCRQAGEAARFAQLKLLESQAPGAPCLALTAHRYKSGNPKTLARLHFEEVFRTEARKLGVPEAVIIRQLDP